MYGLFREDEGTVELRKMYLDPAEKGRGYGRLLMEEALRLAREAGYRRMVLETNRRLVEAIDMYRKFGFTEEVRPDRSPRCDAAMAMDL
jgi:GNAT superfamily N-acetyltransferase